jgi:chemotaxis protein MotB
MLSKRTYKGFNHEVNRSPAGWQIVYTSFILILLSFFIMLSSFATMAPAKVMQFTRSFSDAVNVLSGGLRFEHGQTILPPTAERVAESGQRPDALQAMGAFAEVLELEQEVELAFQTKGLVMTLSDKALFQMGDAQVTREALPLLNKIGAIISRTGYLVRIEGHTDNLPIQTERFPSNWELSTARAVNVLRYFVEKGQIPPRQLHAVGFGEFQPKYPNDSADNRARNRRVEIIFMRANLDDLSKDARK